MLANWVARGAELLDPLVRTLVQYVLSGAKLHADDTPVPVLCPGRGKTRTARLWAYVRDDRPSGGSDPPAVLYRYSPDRKAQRPEAHLRAFRGVLQADGYSGFAGLYRDGRVLEAACWAHARRKYYDVYTADRSPSALEALQRIGQPGERGGNFLLVGFQHAEQDEEEDILLVLDILVDQAAADPGPARDLLDRGAIEALPREQLRRGGDHLAAAFLHQGPVGHLALDARMLIRLDVHAVLGRCCRAVRPRVERVCQGAGPREACRSSSFPAITSFWISLVPS